MEEGIKQDTIKRLDDDTCLLEQNEKEPDNEFKSEMWKEQDDTLSKGYIDNWMDDLIINKIIKYFNFYN